VKRIIIALLLTLFARAQTTAPPDLHLVLRGEHERVRFYFGEAIRLELGYSAVEAGKYVIAGPGLKIKDYEGPYFSCEPRDAAIDRRQNDGRVSAWRVLHTGPSCQGGVGGGAGGACADCEGLTPLGPKPLIYPITLNQGLQLTRPGTYTCSVTDRTITTSASKPDYRAITVTSTPLTIELVEDPGWASATLKDARAKLVADKCNDPQPPYTCVYTARSIKYLDTPESLAASVDLLLGFVQRPYWQSEVLAGLYQSQNQPEVVRLLEKRYVATDFDVGSDDLEVLTALALRAQSPHAFDRDSKPESYHSQAVLILQRYLRALGGSLPQKSQQAYEFSRETYEKMAADNYCESEAIIPEFERKQVLADADVAAQRSSH
jgi:hypothetical protein